MTAYVIAEIDVTNPAGYNPYTQLVPASIALSGGPFPAPGGRAPSVRGPRPPPPPRDPCISSP